MGRRKIEIQPITHERNRSVTFLKRKAGLFKKAHELGVLCSVDVAVIIFEERPGHHHKLYQYCSGDIQDIVARHVQYNGERDTRGPGDFNGSGTKVEEAGDADDDDADEDEAPPPPPVRSSTKRTAANKPKVADPDPDYTARSSAMAIPSPPMSLRGLPHSNAIPTSSDRDRIHTGNGANNGNGPHKKPRLSHADEDALTLPPPSFSGGNSSGGFNFPPQQPYRGGGGYASPPFFPPGASNGNSGFLNVFDPAPPGARIPYDYAPRRQQNSTNNFSVDWPVHNPAHASSSQHQGASSSWNVDSFIHAIMFPPEFEGGGGGGGVGGAGQDANWLDFLSSGNNNNATGNGITNPPGMGGGGGTSWERQNTKRGTGSSGEGSPRPESSRSRRSDADAAALTSE